MHTDAISEAIRDIAKRLVVPRFRALRPDEIDAKSPGDLVTVADRETEEALTAFFRADDPAALIVGEEATFADPGLVSGLPQAEHAWVIDPVDGTNNFARGRSAFGVMVAEMRRGRTVRSWIWQPIQRRMFVAEVGHGVTCNGEHLEPIPGPPGPVRGRVPRRLRREPVEGFDLRHTSGSCAVDYPALLLGDIDVLAYRHANPWDHAPGALMVTELGGLCAFHGGTPWAVGAHGPVLLAASSPTLWAEADAALVTDQVLFGP